MLTNAWHVLYCIHNTHTSFPRRFLYSFKELDESTVMLGVFDGHGGKEVALYVAKHLARWVTETAEYKEGKAGAALTTAFLGIDRELLSDNAILELKVLGEGGDVRSAPGATREYPSVVPRKFTHHTISKKNRYIFMEQLLLCGKITNSRQCKDLDSCGSFP